MQMNNFSYLSGLPNICLLVLPLLTSYTTMPGQNNRVIGSLVFQEFFLKPLSVLAKNEADERGGHFSNAEGNWVAITFLNGTRLRVSDFRGKGINDRELELLSQDLSA